LASSITVVVRDDPRTSHRPVEALRIALGLAAGEHEITVLLLGDARLLLSDDTDEIVDVDILEKYLPSFKQLAIPFVVSSTAEIAPTFQPGFAIERRDADMINRLLTTADHTLVF
jgi:sulfur relay (sulfurtransferase) DsrF/TusC family protein